MYKCEIALNFYTHVQNTKIKNQVAITTTNGEISVPANGYVEKSYSVPKSGYNLAAVMFRFSGAGSAQKIFPKSLYVTGIDSFDATWLNLESGDITCSVGYYLVYVKNE